MNHAMDFPTAASDPKAAPGQTTPFAEAINSFLRDTKQRNESDNTIFYKEALVQVSTHHNGANGGPSSQSLDRSRECADRLAAFIEDLARTRKRDSKTLRLADRLRPLINGLGQFTTACDVMIQAAPSAAIVLYGGARLVLQLAQRSYECHDTIVDMLAEIGHLLRCYNLFSVAHADCTDMHAVLVSSYKTIVEFWQKASELLSRKTYKLLLLNAVKPLEKEWQRCHDAMEKDRRRVEFYAMAVNAKVLRQKDVGTTAHKLGELKKQIVAWIKGGEDDESLDCRGTVRANVDKRHPGTCDWLLDHGDFEAWLATNKSTSLFLSAAPGAGKTILASTAVRRLQDRGLRTIAFFYSFDDVARRNAITALRALALQLMAFHDTVPESVQKLYQADAANHCSKLNDTLTAVELLKALMKQIPRVHIVIDGLDECRDSTGMLLILRLLLEAQTYGIVKWLFTSRPERQIRTELLRYGAVEISAPMQSLTSDIRVFMTDRLQNKKCTGCIDDWISQCQGNFLWASLMLQVMDGEGLTCEEDVEEELENFPQGLTGCYLRTLHQLARRSERQQELARRIFAFLVASVQPLRLSELSHALAATTRSTDYSPKRVPILSLVEELCSNLVSFDRSVKGGAQDPVLKFAHKSIQDFFLLDGATMDAPRDVQRFFTTFESANMELGQACLQYLSYRRYDVPHEVPILIQNSEHAFLRYAAIYWFRHLSDVAPTQELRDHVQAFIGSSAFWNCLSVQCRVAPHLYGRFHKVSRNTFGLGTSGRTKVEQADSGVKYGSPIPTWMDTSSVQDFHAFVVQWHQVLNSFPDHVGQCVMDQRWGARWSQKRVWESKRPKCWAIESHSSAVDDILSHMAITDADLTQRCRTLQNSGDALCHHLESPPSLLTLAQIHDVDDAALLSLPRSSRSLAIRSHMSHHRQNEAEVCDASSQHSRSCNCHALSCSVNQPANERTGAHPATVVQWICNVDRIPKKEQSHSPHDSGLESVDSDDDMESENSSDNDEDAAIPLSGRAATEYLLMISQAGREPAAYSWTSASSNIVIKCTFHPTEPWVLWSPSAHECCIADMESKSIEKIVLPEPADVDLAAAEFAHKEFHYSEANDQLHYLLFTASSNQCGIDCTLSISSFNLVHTDGGQALLHRTALATTLRYSSADAIQAPYVVATWTPGSVYIALPPLSCNPKVVRTSLPLREQPSSTHPFPLAFETLTRPIFFPASTLQRDPSLKYLLPPTSSEKATLVLTLAGRRPTAGVERASTDAHAHEESPTLMAWPLHNHDDWRDWDVASDAQSDAYSGAHGVFERLRGTYVDANQRFCVPIRSGLDWRKQAFVSCA